MFTITFRGGILYGTPCNPKQVEYGLWISEKKKLLSSLTQMLAARRNKKPNSGIFYDHSKYQKGLFILPVDCIGPAGLLHRLTDWAQIRTKRSFLKVIYRYQVRN